MKKYKNTIIFWVLLLIFTFSENLLADLPQRQRVIFENREKWFGEKDPWSVSYDEETNSLYMKVWLEADKSPCALWNEKRRGNYILRANRVGDDYAHFIIPDDQSELDNINCKLKEDVFSPNVVTLSDKSKYLFFVTGGYHSSLNQNATIHVAKWNPALKKWEINPEDQQMLKYVNTDGLETLPIVTDNGLTLYFTSDSNRGEVGQPCDGTCACDDAGSYLAGTCFGQYKYVRDSLSEPFRPLADGKQVLSNGRIHYVYLRNVTIGGKFYEEWDGLAAMTKSDNNLFFFNGPDVSGKDWDHIWMAYWEGEKMIDAFDIKLINGVPDEGLKEKPEVIADGSGLYWSSGKTAITEKLYYLNLNEYIKARLVGDLNNDGLVNTKDVKKLIDIIFGWQQKSQAADLNTDGEVNFIDLLSLIKLILSAEAN